MPRIIAAIFALTSACWLACALAGAIAAAAMFPAARELPLSLAGYETFLAADQSAGRMLVAGFLAERVFESANTLQVPIAMVAIATFLLIGLLEGRSAWLSARGIALVIAAGALAALVWWSQPAFRELDAQYRAAAAQGDVSAATAQKPAVDAAHERASMCAKVEVCALLALIALHAGHAPRGRKERLGGAGVPVGWNSRG